MLMDDEVEGEQKWKWMDSVGNLNDEARAPSSTKTWCLLIIESITYGPSQRKVCRLANTYRSFRYMPDSYDV